MPTWPIIRTDGRIIVTPHGKYGFIRRTEADGGCGAANQYPCTHWGVDLAGEAGTPVVAPESGLITRWGWGDKPPLRGYGPGVVLLKGTSGWWHLLGHLEQSDLTKRMAARGDIMHNADPDEALALGPVREGDQLGVTSGLNHVHWEVRRTYDASPSKERATVNPGEWLKQQGGTDGAWALGLTTAEAEQDGGGAALLALALLLLKD